MFGVKRETVTSVSGAVLEVERPEPQPKPKREPKPAPVVTRTVEPPPVPTAVRVVTVAPVVKPQPVSCQVTTIPTVWRKSGEPVQKCARCGHYFVGKYAVRMFRDALACNTCRRQIIDALNGV
ncbi:MAG TPA: hypothetical protein VMW48_07330 [Vicinamibacterales bacterium]|nr:hypothetical protein [Vicinamibacterales bacterium]